MATHPKYPNVFSPVKIGPVELENRYYFSPHGVPLTVGCSPSNDLVAYVTERVKDGGCGLVILSCTAHWRGRDYQPCPYPPSAVPAFRALADAVHEAGGRIFGQIWYHWLSTGHWQPLSPRAPSLGPSNSQFAFGGTSGAVHEVTKEEIRLLGDAHRQSARHLAEAGFDGVEIHASHSGIIEQFISPYYNRRTDEYGGSLDNRLRMLRETLEVVRDGAGDGLAVGMRFNCDELVEGGYDTADAHEAVKAICSQGLVDFVDLDVAMEPLQLKYGMPSVFVDKHFYKPFVEQVRGATGDIPVLSVLGRITDMAEGEAALAPGLCDMVGSARQLIAEPQFVAQARAGTEHLGRVCIACNHCLGGMADASFGCAINPASYRERLWGVDTFTPAAKPSKVVVVGGGPGGLEAARVAALRGHTVTLFEANEHLGGALELWARLPGRGFYRHSIDWWEKELDRLGVTVRKGVKASAEDVLALSPDAVIVATGGRFSREGRSGQFDREIPGANQPHVYSPEAILEGRANPEGRVVVIDGEGTHASAGVAEMLGKRGAEVIMVSSNHAPYSNRVVMAFEGDPVSRRLAEANVTFRQQTWVSEIRQHDVLTFDPYSEWEGEIEKVDAVVLVTGRESVNTLTAELEGKAAQLFVIGDALCVRPMATAPYEGQKFARLIGEDGAPASMGQAFFAEEDYGLYPSVAGS